MKGAGKPDDRKGHVRFDVAGAGNGFTVRLVRHRQTKETEQIGFTYGTPRQSSTLLAAAAGFAAGKRCARTPWAASFGAILLLRSEALKEALFLQLVDQTFIEKSLGRFGTPDEIATAIVFLASDDASYIARTELFVDAGIAQV